MRKCLLVLLSLTLFMTLLVGSVGAQDKPVIAFSQCTMNHPWRVAMTEDVKYWAEKLDVELIWNNGQNDAAKQLSAAEDLLTREPDALIISPLQAKALDPILETAAEDNIPVISIDRGLASAPGTGMYISHITRDNTAIASELAKFVVDTIGEEGNIIEIQGTVGASATIERHNGFKDVIDEYPDIEILASQAADYLRSDAIEVMENYLQNYSEGEIDVIYTHNDEMALGAIEAIKSAGRDELLGKVVSVDGQRNALKSILDGNHLAVAQYSPYFAEVAIKSALEYLEGGEVPIKQLLKFRVFHAQTDEAESELEEYYYKLQQEDVNY